MAHSASGSPTRVAIASCPCARPAGSTPSLGYAKVARPEQVTTAARWGPRTLKGGVQQTLRQQGDVGQVSPRERETRRRQMQHPHQTAYGQIADRIRDEILAGSYEPSPEDPGRDQLPSAAELGARFGVSGKTAARATQQLVAEGLVVARPGMRPVVVPRTQRPDRWQMQGRYARARQAGGVVFGSDMQGRDVRKRDTGYGGPVEASDQIQALLRLSTDLRVFFRSRQTVVDGRVAEISTSFFPYVLAAGSVLAKTEPLPPGGMTHALESLGHTIAATTNEVRARLASAEELRLFTPDPALQPLTGRIVIEIAHATYGDLGEPLEAVISVRPATHNVIVFETNEGTGDG